MATMAELKKALSVSRPKPTGTEVDLGKVATLVLDATKKAQEGDDDEKADELLEELSEVVKAAEALVGSLEGDDEVGYFAPETVVVAEEVKATKAVHPFTVRAGGKGFQVVNAEGKVVWDGTSQSEANAQAARMNANFAKAAHPDKKKKADDSESTETQKGAQPFQADFDIASRDQEWDPTEALERVTELAKDEKGAVDMATVRKAFLWAPEDEDDPANFKFPICDVLKVEDQEDDDEMIVVEAALDLVIGEAGLLAKSDISDEDRLEIKKSLCRYFSRVAMARDDDMIESGYEDEIAKVEEIEVMGKGEDDDGGWLTDMSPADPPKERGERMLKSEVPNRGDRRAKHAKVRERVRARKARPTTT